MDEAERDNSPDDPSFPQAPQKADRELLPVEVLADLLGSGDFPVQVDDPEAAAPAPSLAILHRHSTSVANGA